MRNIILTILLCVTIWSCGSRKVEKQTDKVDVKIEKEVEKEVVKDSEAKKNELVNTNTKETIEEDESVVEPIDPDKEMIVDGKSYTNAKLKTKKTKSTKDTKEQKKASEILKTKEVEKLKQKDKVDLSQKSTLKQIERTESFFFSIWFWLILLAVLFTMYYLFKKYKDKIWFI